MRGLTFTDAEANAAVFRRGIAVAAGVHERYCRIAFRRSGRRRRRLLDDGESIVVDYTIELASEAAAEDAAGEIGSLSSSEMTTVIVEAAIALGDSDAFTDIETTAVDAPIIYEVTAQPLLGPTPRPSTSPTAAPGAPTSGGGSSGSGGSGGGGVVIIAGAVAGLVVVVAGAGIYARTRRKVAAVSPRDAQKSAPHLAPADYIFPLRASQPFRPPAAPEPAAAPPPPESAAAPPLLEPAAPSLPGYEPLPPSALVSSTHSGSPRLPPL